MESADRSNGARKDEDVPNDTLSEYPVLSMTEAQYTAWCKPWMNSLIVKVLGLSIPKHVLFDRVRRMWKPQQPLKVVPLNNDYYIVSFSNKEDRDYAFSEGPWMIDDHYLLVQRWRPNFNPWSADRHRKIAVWVRIPDLPMEFCTVESLGMIGNMIGKIVKIDRSTSIYEKRGFARICVEIDLQSPLLLAFKVFGEVKQLVYEGLHLVCFGCGMYGHEEVVCPDREVVEDGPEKNLGSNGSDGTTKQAPVDGVNGKEERSTVAASVSGGREEAIRNKMVASNAQHRTDEAIPVGLKTGSVNGKQQSVETSRKKVARNSGQARQEKMVGTDVSLKGSSEENRASPAALFSGGIRPSGSTGSGRSNFLGPQMLDLRGKMTRDSREIADGSRGGSQKGINQVKRGSLNKSNMINGPLEKPKSEWVLVGSKRKKEEKLKLFDKENRVIDRPKFKLMEAVEKGAHFVEITNQYSSLPEEDSTDMVQSEVVIHGKSVSDPLLR
ncbi:hypothetical protein K1719_020244 [Acacia pycnantha]|nr:hypothetical protein K1719_020244 [Acacia pycnantha]